MITWLSVCVVVFICDVGTRGHVHKIKGLDHFDGNVIFTVEIFVCHLYRSMYLDDWILNGSLRKNLTF